MNYLHQKLVFLFLVALCTFGVSEIYAGTCDVRHSQINFGEYSALKEKPEKTNSQVELYCEGIGSYQIAVSSGYGEFRRRKMRSNKDHLFYNLFLNAGLNQIWGDGTGNTHLMNGYYRSNGNNYSRNEHYYYGAIYPRQDTYPGRFKDDIFISISF